MRWYHYIFCIKIIIIHTAAAAVAGAGSTLKVVYIENCLHLRHAFKYILFCILCTYLQKYFIQKPPSIQTIKITGLMPMTYTFFFLLLIFTYIRRLQQFCVWHSTARCFFFGLYLCTLFLVINSLTVS